jgi:sarcosine oxidase
MALDRRSFIKVAGAQAGLLAAAPSVLDAALTEGRAPGVSTRAPEVVVIGAGAWGGWTAYWLRQMGANVTIVDQYGPGNSRATSGDHSRGIRSSYPGNELWTSWAIESIKRWKKFDAEWSREVRMQLYFNTGDLILRPDTDTTFIENTRPIWDKLGNKYEMLTIDEVRYRWPQINPEGMTKACLEIDAGVGRAQRSCEVVAEVAQKNGAKLVIGRASLGARDKDKLQNITTSQGVTLKADAFVFACGPWLTKVFPDVLPGLRNPMGYVAYYGVPADDKRFFYPNMPTFNILGTTGWVSLPVDNKGFRIRGSGGSGPGRMENDPDLSTRMTDPASFDGQRTNFTAKYFPALKDAPILATHACHYEFSPTRQFMVDRHPQLSNVWIAGGGNAEGFKQGPTMGEYIAKRVLGTKTDAALDAAFKLDAAPPPGREEELDENWLREAGY